MKTGIELIAAERQEQIEKHGWSAEHDKHHVCGELSDAAICYAARQYWRNRPQCFDVNMIWPFDEKWWKPAIYSQETYAVDRIRELAKAGALIAAEIDRLQAIESKSE